MTTDEDEETIDAIETFGLAGADADALARGGCGKLGRIKTLDDALAQPVEAERTNRTTDDANARVSRFAALARVRQECLKSSERADFTLKVRRDDDSIAEKARFFSTRLAAVRLHLD